MDSGVEGNARAQPRFARPIRFLRNRISPEKALGLYLTLGVLIAGLCGFAFSEIAERIGPDTPLFAFDQQLTAWFHTHATSTLTTCARAITNLGSVGCVTALSVGCAIFFAVRRMWDRLLVLSLTMIGGSLLNIFLKHLFHRQRPVLENPLVTLTSYGFPSGHTMGSTLLYGLLAMMIAHGCKSWSGRLLVFCTAALWIAAIGVTRIYLGAHYFTDVVAAVLAGLVWLTFCWTTVETFRRRRHRAAAGA